MPFKLKCAVRIDLWLDIYHSNIRPFLNYMFHESFPFRLFFGDQRLICLENWAILSLGILHALWTVLNLFRMVDLLGLGDCSTKWSGADFKRNIK